MEKQTRVVAIQCQSCEDIIYSRARHDFRYCSCGNVSIDGGFDYVKIGWEPSCSMPSRFTIYVRATKREIYDDWNRGENRFGMISVEDSC